MVKACQNPKKGGHGKREMGGGEGGCPKLPRGDLLVAPPESERSSAETLPFFFFSERINMTSAYTLLFLRATVTSSFPFLLLLP